MVYSYPLWNLRASVNAILIQGREELFKDTLRDIVDAYVIEKTADRSNSLQWLLTVGCKVQICGLHVPSANFLEWYNTVKGNHLRINCSVSREFYPLANRVDTTECAVIKHAQ